MASTVVEQAEQLLPGWVRWLPLVWVPLSFVVSFGITWLAVRSVTPRGAAEDEHWTVRARFWFGARLAVLVALFGAVSVSALITRVGGLSAIPRELHHGLTFVAILGGVYFGGYRRAQRKYARKKSPATRFKDAVLLGVLFLPGYLVTALLFPIAGWPAAVVGVVLLIVLAWRVAFRLVVWMRLARPADPSLQLRIDRLCEQAGERPVSVWVLDWSMANACALVYERKLAFSTRCLEVLDESEADAIAAHELGHLTEGAWVRRARLAAAPAPLCLLLSFEIGGWSLLAFFGWLAFGYLLSARMERRADREATRLSEPKCYARALCRLHEDALLPAVVGAGGSAHGSLYDRMLSAGIQPDFPRPEKPRVGRAVAWVAASMVVGLAFAIATRAMFRPRSIQGLEIAAALDDLDVPRLARAEALRGSMQRARVFAEAGVTLRPERPEALYELLMVELRTTDCVRVHDLEARLATLAGAEPYLGRLWRSREYGACGATRD